MSVHTANEKKNQKKLNKIQERLRREKNAWMDQWEDKTSIDWTKFDKTVLYEDDPQRKWFDWIINGVTKHKQCGQDMYTVYYCDPQKAGNRVPDTMGFHSEVFTLRRLLLCHDISTAFYKAIDAADYGDNVAAIGARMCKLSNTKKVQELYAFHVPPFGM